MTSLRRLVWLYLGLLIFEGALRKWIVPSLDTPLLIIRDPVALLIYLLAYQNRLSFQNAFFMPNLVLAVSTSLLALAFGSGNLFVTIYGLRTDFLQIPLIFLIPQILNRDDVIAMGRFILLVSIPIAALVILQFKSPPDSWLNKGALETHYGTVRPSGVFSFVTGTVAFFALTSAFLFYGYVQGGIYKIWLLAPATFGILIAAACSGSRSCLVSIGLVGAVAILSVILRGRGGLGMVLGAALVFVALFFLSSLPVFKQGSEQLMQRFADAGAHEGNAQGFVDRYFGTMLVPLAQLGDAPLFGHGLGLGTNAAAGMLHGKREFIGPEDEWGRLIFECGPVFGLLLCLFRAALTLVVARSAWQAFRRGNILPFLLFAATGLLVLNGQWGVPTTLGFAIFGAGLVLTACEEEEDDEDEDEEFDETGEEEA